MDKRACAISVYLACFLPITPSSFLPTIREQYSAATGRAHGDNDRREGPSGALTTILFYP